MKITRTDVHKALFVSQVYYQSALHQAQREAEWAGFVRSRARINIDA
ncbi:MAG TPA: hypothetical protein VGD95_07790 [Micavibrio sp.]